MKKNAMLKIAAILMVAVLLTTCAISSTFAKYAFVNTASATARVAKFGITQTAAATIEGFSKTYVNETPAASEIVNSVVSSDDSALLAPGTTGTIKVTGAISGTPEVAVLSKTYFEFVTTGFGEDYFPIYFTVNGVDYKHSSIGGQHATMADLFTAVSVAAGGEVYVEANQPVNEQSAKDITWTWDFEQENNVDGNGDGIKDKDAKDVALTTVDGGCSLTITLKQEIVQIN